MARVTLFQMTFLAWRCTHCGWSVGHPESDPLTGEAAEVAAAHQTSCGYPVRMVALPGGIGARVEAPAGAETSPLG